MSVKYKTNTKPINITQNKTVYSMNYQQDYVSTKNQPKVSIIINMAKMKDKIIIEVHIMMCILPRRSPVSLSISPPNCASFHCHLVIFVHSLKYHSFIHCLCVEPMNRYMVCKYR